MQPWPRKEARGEPAADRYDATRSHRRAEDPTSRTSTRRCSAHPRPTAREAALAQPQLPRPKPSAERVVWGRDVSLSSVWRFVKWQSDSQFTHCIVQIGSAFMGISIVRVDRRALHYFADATLYQIQPVVSSSLYLPAEYACGRQEPR